MRPLLGPPLLAASLTLASPAPLDAQCTSAWRGTSLVDRMPEWLPSAGEFYPLFATSDAPLRAPVGAVKVAVNADGTVDTARTEFSIDGGGEDSVRAEVLRWRFRPASYRSCPVGSEIRAAIIRFEMAPQVPRHGALRVPLLDSAEAVTRELLVRLGREQWRGAVSLIDSVTAARFQANAVLNLVRNTRAASPPGAPHGPIPLAVKELWARFDVDSARIAAVEGVELTGVGSDVTLGDFMRMPPRTAMEAMMRAKWRTVRGWGPLEITGSRFESDSMLLVDVTVVANPGPSAPVMLVRRGSTVRVVPGFPSLLSVDEHSLEIGTEGVFEHVSPFRSLPSTRRAEGCTTNYAGAANVDSTPRWIASAGVFRPLTDGRRSREREITVVRLDVDSLGIASSPMLTGSMRTALGDSILAEARHWRFTPAVMDGCHVRIGFTVPVVRQSDFPGGDAKVPRITRREAPPQGPAAIVTTYFTARAVGDAAGAAALIDPQSLRSFRDASVRFLVHWARRDSALVAAGLPLDGTRASWNSRDALDSAAFARYRDLPLPNLAPGVTIGTLATMEPHRVVQLLFATYPPLGAASIRPVRGTVIEGDSVAHILTAERSYGPDDPWPSTTYHVVKRSGRWYLYPSVSVLNPTMFMAHGPNARLTR